MSSCTKQEASRRKGLSSQLHTLLSPSSINMIVDSLKLRHFLPKFRTHRLAKWVSVTQNAQFRPLLHLQDTKAQSLQKLSYAQCAVLSMASRGVHLDAAAAIPRASNIAISLCKHILIPSALSGKALRSFSRRCSPNSLATLSMDEPESDDGAENPEDGGEEREGLDRSVATTETVEADLIPAEGVTVTRKVICPFNQDSKGSEPCKAEEKVHRPFGGEEMC